MRYLLNSAVITSPGTYKYSLITADQATEWIREGNFISRVGYPATADHIQNISGIRPRLSREATAMQAGDEALVVRLTYRVQEPGMKKEYTPGPNDWEYGILLREA